MVDLCLIEKTDRSLFNPIIFLNGTLIATKISMIAPLTSRSQTKFPFKRSTDSYSWSKKSGSAGFRWLIHWNVYRAGCCPVQFLFLKLGFVVFDVRNSIWVVLFTRQCKMFWKCVIFCCHLGGTQYELKRNYALQSRIATICQSYRTHSCVKKRIWKEL